MALKSERVCAAFAFDATGKHMAAASVAGAMDDDFGSDAFIHIYDSSLRNFETQEMPLKAKVPIPDRVHRLDWSPHNGGIIAAGLTDGTVMLWSADGLLKEGVKLTESQDNAGSLDGPELERSEAILYESKLHQLAVKGCHFNPQQPQFLATGGADKELFVWNVQDPKNPLRVPSIPNSTQVAEITDLCWNPRYAHILGVTMSNGGVVVWDLKSKRPASTFNVSQNSSAACTTLAWHPEVATHLVVARDDPSPVIQVWDLRKATAPMREIAMHTAGVLSMAWSQFDANLLASCGRDGRTCFCNPNTGTTLGELDKQDNWVFAVKWAPRTPAAIATASYDSQLALHATQSAVASADAPKWLQRPTPAVFGYGGRIARRGGSNSKIVVQASTTASEANSVSSQQREFFKVMGETPHGSAERAAWIGDATQGLEPVTAAAKCSAENTRAPLMAQAGVAPDEVLEEVEKVEMPWTGSEADFERLCARCIAAGHMQAAVSLCLKADRFDDAFAVAQLCGRDEVSRVYDAYVERRASRLRHAKYLGAMCNGNFAQLAADAAANSVPWGEVLALYASAVKRDDYAATCAALGDAMRNAGHLEAALSAYVAGGNVDGAAATLVARNDRKQHELVQAVTVLESTVSTYAKCPEYASVLAGHADQLAGEGDFAAAMSYASRAAGLGVAEAATVADRMRYLVPKEQRADVKPPFQTLPLPEPTSPECQMLAGRQQQIARPAAQPAAQPAVAAAAHAAGRQAAVQPMVQPARQPVAPQPAQPQPVAPMPPQPQPVVPQPQPVAPQPLQPQPVAPMPPQPQPVAPQPPQPQPTVPARSPVQPAPTMPARPTHADPARGAAAAASPAVDVSALPADQQDLVARINAAATAIGEKRKREAVEKAAGDMARRLVAGAVSAEAVALLIDFANKLGTPDSRAVWKKLNDDHFDSIKGFLSIKFL